MCIYPKNSLYNMDEAYSGTEAEVSSTKQSMRHDSSKYSIKYS